MSLVATVVAMLPLLLGVGDGFRSDLAEVGGRVLAESTGRPLPSPVPVTLRLHADGTVVAASEVGLDGSYALRAPPGTYWAQLLVGSEEVLAERVTLTAGSWRRDFQVPAPAPAVPAPLLTRGSDTRAHPDGPALLPATWNRSDAPLPPPPAGSVR